MVACAAAGVLYPGGAARPGLSKALLGQVRQIVRLVTYNACGLQHTT